MNVILFENNPVGNLFFNIKDLLQMTNTLRKYAFL